MSTLTPRNDWHSALRLVAAATLALSVGASPSPAWAQGESALAEALFREGKTLMDQGKFAEACPKLGESYRLEPKTGALLNLAVCQQSAGLHASAWASFSSVVNLAHRDGNAEREAFAREQATLLEKVLARLTISGFPEGVTVTLDGKPLERAAIGLALPLDPGSHRVVARAPGKKDWEFEVVAPSTKAELTLAIPPLVDASPTAAPPGPRVPANEEPAEPRGGYRTLALTGFVVGAVAAIGGGITGGLSLSKTGEIKDTCTDTRCPASQSDAIDQATLLANLSNVSFALAAVGVGVGVTGLVLGSGDASDERPAARAQVVVGPGAVGLQGRF